MSDNELLDLLGAFDDVIALPACFAVQSYGARALSRSRKQSRSPPMKAPELRFCGVGVAGFEPTASSS